MLNIKSITTYKINDTPLFSSYLPESIIKNLKFMNDNFEKLKFEKNDLVILSVNGLYGYRTGICGLLTNFLSSKISIYNEPTFLSRCFNSLCSEELVNNDYEMFSLLVTMISRTLPIFNIGNWDLKREICDNKYLNYNNNNSLPNIFNLNSIYMLKPLFDSGMGIYSNRKPIFSGFEKWDINSTLLGIKYSLYNKGISWYFYESDNKTNGICILNVSLFDHVPDLLINLQLEQIVKLKNNLIKKYSDIYEKYETIVIGDFKIEFNLRDIIPEIYLKWKIIEEGNLKILGKNDISNTEFILYEEKFLKYNLDVIKTDCIKTENDTLFSIELKKNILENSQSINNIEEPNYLIDKSTKIETNNIKEIVSEEEPNYLIDKSTKIETNNIKDIVSEEEPNYLNDIEKSKKIENSQSINNIKEIDNEQYKVSLVKFKIDIEKSEKNETNNIEIKDNYFSESNLFERVHSFVQEKVKTAFSNKEPNSDEEWQQI